MSFDAGQMDIPDRMTVLLRQASEPSEALIGDVIRNCCRRVPILIRTGKATRIGQLIRAGAWLDAALALIGCELPQWTLRRFLYEDGEWHCSFSRQPNLPLDFDDLAEGCHAVLPLALLMALVEARRQMEHETIAVVQSDRRTTEFGIAICCDNFV